MKPRLARLAHTRLALAVAAALLAVATAYAADSTAVKKPATPATHPGGTTGTSSGAHGAAPGGSPHGMPPDMSAPPVGKADAGPGWKLPPGQTPVVTRTEPGPELKPGEKLKFQTVSLHVFHRVFRNFHDHIVAKMKQEFRIGDSEYTGTIVEFVPDFALDLKNHKVTTRGQEPNNPAWRIIVKKNGAPMDTAWAFMDMQPHFTRNALLGFIATRATFENHGAVTSRDSLAMKLLQSEGK